MDRGKILKGVSIAEAAVGLFFSSIAIWSYSNMLLCPEDSWDCKGWALLGIYIVAPIAFFFLAAALTSFKARSWYSQVFLVPAFAWGLYWLII
jgi:hypothetical protein